MELLGAAAVAIVACFAAGTIWNVARGRALLRWMQGGLRVLGERTAVRWLGSSVVELAIRDARAPFAAVTVIVFLEARDMPWQWAWGRLRGRRDTLIVRGALRETPGLELEALDPASWSGREAVRRVPPGWGVRGGSAGELAVHYASAAALTAADMLLTQARSAGLGVQRLSVRRAEPKFELHLRLPDQRQPAPEFFQSVRALAERTLP